jgi:HAE1 family hydrophobic/amphiphilic exporter-1
MLPLALGTGPGSEERRAVAIVVIGGQTMALLLTLLVTPVAYSFFDDLGRLARRLRRATHDPEVATPVEPKSPKRGRQDALEPTAV